MARKKDTELYIYFKGFRIHKGTKKIVSLKYYDPKLQKNMKLSHDPNPKVENTEAKTYYLPNFEVKTLDKDRLLKDEGFLKALDFKSKFNREHHAGIERAKARVEWISQWGDKEKEIEKFAKWRKKTSPNNWENDVRFLRQVVFKFFLGEKVCANPLNWYQHHYDFKEWLNNLKPIQKKKTDSYSPNSLNNIIRSLNAYYKYLEVVENQIVVNRCPQIEKHLLNEKTEECVISEEEQEKIIRALESFEPSRGTKEYKKDLTRKLVILYKTLLNSGMRKNEALGLSLQDIAIGKLRVDFGYITDSLKVLGVEVFGHIYLESQPKLNSIRAEDGSVPRKPLKLKKKINSENSRYIPLMDRETTKLLGELIREQKKLYEKRKHGDDLSNYLLFDGVSYNTLNTVLTKIYEGKSFEKMHNFTVHDTRHTFSTRFCLLVRGQVSIVSKVLGHSREQITQKYLHLSDKLNTQEGISNTVETIEEIDLNNLKAL